MPAMQIAAIVLAAGEGRRMGGPKALLPLAGTTFLARLCSLFASEGASPVIAVLGAEAERVSRDAGVPDGAVTVVNERWRDGMLTSVWRGLEEAEARGAAAALLHPVDNPHVTRATVAAVAAALRSGALVAAPSHAGRRGHPAGFARDAWPALRAAPVAGGARTVLSQHPEWVVHVPAGPDCLVDLDSPSDLQRS
jgi:nicotine blue oxidoreductase